jgi:hypothetical protein
MSTDPNSALHTLEQEKQQKHNGQVQRWEGRRRVEAAATCWWRFVSTRTRTASMSSSTPPRRSLTRARPSSCPSAFDAFEFIPSVGAYGGTIIIWKSSLFSGAKIFKNDYCLSVEFSSKFNSESWVLSNIYAPCTATGKREFLLWFKNIQMLDHINWLIVADFMSHSFLRIK